VSVGSSEDDQKPDTHIREYGGKVAGS